MGTNYYAKIKDEDVEIHIGKSSSAWRFCIAENRNYYRTPLQLFEFLSRIDVRIEDEYGREILGTEIVLKIIRDSRSGKIGSIDDRMSYTINGYWFKAGEFS